MFQQASKRKNKYSDLSMVKMKFSAKNSLFPAAMLAAMLFAPCISARSNEAPGKITLRDGNTALRFKNGEYLNAGVFPGGGNAIKFDLSPDPENPNVAEVFKCGKLSLHLEKFQLCVTTASGKITHPAVLIQDNFNPVTLASDGKLITLTIGSGDPVVMGEAAGFAGKTEFSASTAKTRFRGKIRNFRIVPFTGKIVPPQKKALPSQLITIGSEFPQKADLSGKWDFFCIPKSFKPDAPLPDARRFTAKMVIPGYWDDHYDLIRETRSFDRSVRTNPRYRPLSLPMGEMVPDATMPYLTGTGYYRKNISFAPGTKPAAVTLQLGPAVWGAAVYCNGKLAAYNPGYSTWTECRLDKYLDFNGVNTLIIAVSNFDKVFDGNTQENSQHIGVSVRGYQGMRCGIAGGVTLKISQEGAITDAYARFDGKKLHLHADASVDADILWTIRDAKNTLIRQIFGKNASTGVDGMQWWSEKDPVLYRIEAILSKEGKILDRYEFSYGLRQISCAGPQIIFNGKPIFLRGLTEHHFFPETINAPYDQEKYIRDIKTWQSYGFNFLRFHTWCPPEPYLDAADRCGVICQVEVPPHIDEAEWRRILKYLRRHVSVMIICGGNEEDFTASRIAELKRLSEVTAEMIPEALFNPQEGLSKVEYRMTPDVPGVVTEPFIHHPGRLKQIAEFSDCYGSYSWGFFSYIHTEFPGAAEINKRYAIYNKPILSHEVGIIGNFLNFKNEKLYEKCRIPAEVYQEARKYLTRCGIFHRTDEFYRMNCEAANRQRKAMLENLRSCRTVAGYDLLGAYDAHWHRCGYPCGPLDEFNAPKHGITPEYMQQINGETILFTDADCYRAKAEKSVFTQNIGISHFGRETLKNGVLQWQLKAGNEIFSGKNQLAEIIPGSVINIAKCELTLPDVSEPVKAVLYAEVAANGKKYTNSWDFWIFPRPENKEVPANVKIAAKLNDELIDFIANGGRVLLTANFPTGKMVEKFQLITAGRSSGHHGIIIGNHPLLAGMVHEGFADWQFFALLRHAVSMDFTGSELPFNPLIEYIPSYKLVRHKTPLCELRIGKGVLLMCGLRFENFDPAGNYLYGKIIDYLAGDTLVPAPEVKSTLLKRLIRQEFPDLSVAKTDEAWDPNVSAGKNRKK